MVKVTIFKSQLLSQRKPIFVVNCYHYSKNYPKMLATLSVVLVFFVLVFSGMAIRILLLKDGQFKGTCASQSPFLKSELGECSVCGKNVDEGECGMDDKPKKQPNPLRAAKTIFRSEFRDRG